MGQSQKRPTTPVPVGPYILRHDLMQTGQLSRAAQHACVTTVGTVKSALSTKETYKANGS